MKNIIRTSSFVLLFGFCLSLSAQEFLGLYGPRNASLTFVNGNAYSVSEAFFSPNTNQSVDPTFGAVSVSAEFTGQEYPDIDEPATSPATTPHHMLMFGARANTTAKSLLSHKVFQPMTDVASPSNDYYMATESGDALSVIDNYAFVQFATLEEFENQHFMPTLADYVAGEITYTFSKPVDDPLLHVTGLGGHFSQFHNNGDITVALVSIAYRLIHEGNVTGITMLDGTVKTQLSGDTIKNIFDADDYDDPNNGVGSQGDEAGSGTFKIIGKNITTVKFEIILQGKYPGQVHWSSHDTGSNPDTVLRYAGDRYNATWTLPLYTFGGSVVIDDTRDGIVSGTPYTSGSPDYGPLNAVLVDEDGNVVQVAAVSATDGTFDFMGVLGENYSVMITTEDPTIGSPAPATAMLPTVYRSQEEEFNNGGADPVQDSKTNSFVVEHATVGSITDNSLIFGITSIPLPVELVSFDAKRNGKSVELTWSTATEINNDYFDVEHSSDAEHFEKIGQVKGAGNTSEVQHYAFTHAFPVKGDNYYRLKQVDFDGAYKYTPIRLVRFEELAPGKFKVNYYPNPTRDQINIVSNRLVENYEMLVYDIDGKLVLRRPFVSGMIIDLSAYSQGVYLMHLVDAKGQTKSIDRIVKMD